jgi:hypothetical protein
VKTIHPAKFEDIMIAHRRRQEHGSAGGHAQSKGFTFTVVPYMDLEDVESLGECILLQRIIMALEDMGCPILL